MRKMILAAALIAVFALPMFASGAAAATVVNPDGSASGPFGTYSNAQRLQVCSGLRPGSDEYKRLRCDWNPAS